MVICCAADCGHEDCSNSCSFSSFLWDPPGRTNSGPVKSYLCSCHGTKERTAMDSLPSGGEGDSVQVPLVSSGQQLTTRYRAIFKNMKHVNSVPLKRSDYIDWEEYFMATALLSARRSKDPVTQVGACLVNSHQVIVGIGYNGMPRGCDDDLFPWGKSTHPLQSKQLYVCHAELNAVLNANCSDLSDCSLYTVLFPCNECAKIIIQARIKQIVYLSDKKDGKESNLAAKRMFSAAQVTYKQFQPRRSKIELDFCDV